MSHGPGPAIGYAIVEPERKGRFDPDEAARLGVPEGPLWGQLHRGLAVTLPDGRTVSHPSCRVRGTRAGGCWPGSSTSCRRDMYMPSKFTGCNITGEKPARVRWT